MQHVAAVPARQKILLATGSGDCSISLPNHRLLMTEVRGRTVCANASLGWAWWPFLSNCVQDGAWWLVVLPVANPALTHTVLTGCLQGQHAGMRAACMQVRRS